MANLPTYNELCDEYGYRRNDEEFDGSKRQPLFVSSDSGAAAWSFVMMARSRGWTVSDPMPHGYKDIHHVTVWSVGVSDQRAEGRFRR